MSTECIFCKMGDGRLPVPKVYEDAEFFCIRDIQPHAKIHLLLIPKKHIASLDEAFPIQGGENTLLLGRMFSIATQIARENGLLPDGFRTVINTGPNGGQTVLHLHMHIIGGEALQGRLG